MLAAIPSQVWLPVATLVLGYVFSLVTEAFRDRRLSTREREARAADRDAVQASVDRERADLRREFQRESLLELQEVLIHLIRVYGEEHTQDVTTSRKAGQWKQFLLGGDISDRNFALTQRKTMLVARVDDVEVRETVREMVEAGASLMFAKSEEESDAHIQHAADAFTRANDRIGVLLREF